MDRTPAEAEANGRVGELIHRISDDVKTIARDEVELVRDELKTAARAAAADAAGALLGAIVALIGLGMLCLAAVAAIWLVLPLWAALLIMAGGYLIFGGALAGGFAAKLKGEKPKLEVAAYEGKATIKGAAEALATKEAHGHA